MSNKEISYLICALPRSGSSVVCDALSATESAGHPREYFQPEAVPKWLASMSMPTDMTPRRYLEALQREKSTSNGVFGAKIMRSHFDGWLAGLAEGKIEVAAPKLLASLLPGLRFVWMRRQDLIRQAISLVRASQTGLWHTREPGRQPKMEPHYDFKEIDSKVRMLKRHDAEWKSFFEQHELQPVKIVYETFADDMASSVNSLLEALGIATPDKETLFRRPLALNRQSDAINEEWAERYRIEKMPA